MTPFAVPEQTTREPRVAAAVHRSRSATMSAPLTARWSRCATGSTPTA
jgi:hypothetical protein